MKWVSLESTISDLSSDTTSITIDPIDLELYTFPLLKSSNAHISGYIGPVSMKLGSMTSDLSNDITFIIIDLTGPELYAPTL